MIPDFQSLRPSRVFLYIQNIVLRRYEYWLRQRDAEAAQFVEDFNGFRAASKRKLRGALDELLKVFLHARDLDKILNNVKQHTPLPHPTPLFYFPLSLFC